VPARPSRNIKAYAEDEQTRFLALGLENLRACGFDHLCAFRAGNYGANFATLRALARNGIAFDTSHNAYYLDSACGLRISSLMLQLGRIGGVFEFPTTFFQDSPGHFRYAQLRACSACELEGALLPAWRRGWHAFVLVSHTFELIRRSLWK
jgi:hypothetical protein